MVLLLAISLHSVLAGVSLGRAVQVESIKTSVERAYGFSA